MSTKTENLKLTKPAATDIVDISEINENMDIIDENLATRAEMNTIKKNLDDSDAALKSGYESADKSIRTDLQLTASRIDNLATRAEMNTIKKNLDDSDAALKSGYESADESIRTDLQFTASRIDNLVANTGDSNSEIVDARVGYDNTTYSTLGNAIRKQFENSFNSVFTKINVNLDDAFNGYYNGILLTDVSESQVTITYKNAFYVKKGKSYIITLSYGDSISNSNHRMSFISEGVFISQAIYHIPKENATIKMNFVAKFDGKMFIGVDKNIKSVTCYESIYDDYGDCDLNHTSLIFSSRHECNNDYSIDVNTSRLFKRDEMKNERSYIIKIPNWAKIEVLKPFPSNRFRICLYKNSTPNDCLMNNEVGYLVINDKTQNNCTFNTKDYNLCVVYVQNSDDTLDYNVDNTDFIYTKIKAVYELPKLELGSISYGDGTLTDSNNTRRTLNYINGNMFKSVLHSGKFTVGMRKYTSDLTFVEAKELFSGEKYKLEKEYLYKFVVIDTSTDYYDIKSCFEFEERNEFELEDIFEPVYNENWDKWNDVRYYYGFDREIQPVFHTFKGTLESDTMISVRGGRGRWNKDDNPSSEFVSGGHVFEGWSGKELSRLTMLMGKFHETFACIQTYSPAGLYESNRRFGWIKLGSDEKFKGVDVSQGWTKLYTPMTLPNLSTAPTAITDYDLNPQFSTNDVPIGTMYYDTNLDKVRVYTKGGWKSVSFE